MNLSIYDILIEGSTSHIRGAVQCNFGNRLLHNFVKNWCDDKADLHVRFKSLIVFFQMYIFYWTLPPHGLTIYDKVSERT